MSKFLTCSKKYQLSIFCWLFGTRNRSLEGNSESWVINFACYSNHVCKYPYSNSIYIHYNCPFTINIKLPNLQKQSPGIFYTRTDQLGSSIINCWNIHISARDDRWSYMNETKTKWWWSIHADNYTRKEILFRTINDVWKWNDLCFYCLFSELNLVVFRRFLACVWVVIDHVTHDGGRITCLTGTREGPFSVQACWLFNRTFSLRENEWIFREAENHWGSCEV